MSIKDIVKRAQQEDTYRRILCSFVGTGLPAGERIEGDIWAIAPGVPLPPTVEQNSEPIDGPIYASPKIRWDADRWSEYVRRNTPRPEPAAPVMLTQEDIQRQDGWSDSQWSQAVANGFPRSNAYREPVDGDGYPSGRINLWRDEDIQKWKAAIAALRVSR